jgi:hypothetical protein
MKKSFIVIAPLLLISLFIPVRGALQDSQTISSSGTIVFLSSFKIGIFTCSWNFGEYDAETIAKTFDSSASWYVDPQHDYSQKMNQVHALNPNYKALVYRNVQQVYNYSTDEWNTAAINGWLLKIANGSYCIDQTYPENYRVDIGNPAYQQWLGATVKSWLDRYSFFDGVMTDGGLSTGARDFSCWSPPNLAPINPRTGTYWTDQEVYDGIVGCLNAIINAIGPSKILIANGVWDGEAFFSGQYDSELSGVPGLGVLSEGIFYQSYTANWWTEAQWKQSLDMVVWMQDNLLQKNPNAHFVGAVPIDASSPPLGTTADQLMMFGYCSMMLGAKYSGQNEIGYWGINNQPSLLSLAQRLHALDMVEPLNPYYKINSTSVYARDFVNGKVFVNPTSASYAVTLDTSYATFNGSVVSGSLTINSHTGLILFK